MRAGVVESGTLLTFSVTQMDGQLNKEDNMVLLTLTNHRLTTRKDG